MAKKSTKATESKDYDDPTLRRAYPSKKKAATKKKAVKKKASTKKKAVRKKASKKR